MARNLITAWNNYSFDDFESDEISIVSAIISVVTTGKAIHTNSFQINQGETVHVSMNLTLNSGTLGVIGLMDSSYTDWISNYITLVAGNNDIQLVAEESLADAAIFIIGSELVNFSTSEVAAYIFSNIKYQLLCNGKNGVKSKLIIYEDGYEGEEIDRNVPLNPFKLRKDESNVVCGTSLEFGIRELVDFEFVEFYTNKPQTYKAEFYYPSTTLIWSGYINPQQYNAPYKPAPNTLFFQATDGLGLLKNEPFTLTGFNSELTIIRHCLDKTGLSLGYAIAISVWEINHDITRSVLAQTYIDSVVFSGLNCYEVLEKVLGAGKYDATITQWNNRWRIVSYKDKKATRFLYTSAGVYESTEAAQTVQDLVGYAGSGNQVWPVGILQHSMTAGGKGASIVYDFGRKLSLLDGYDFNLYASSMFTYWTKSGSFGVVRGELQDGTFYAFLGSYSNVDTDYIYQQIAIENAVGDDFVFEFDFAPMGEMFTAYTGASSISMQMRVMVKLTVGGTVYYLTADGWDTTLAYIEQTVNSSIGVPNYYHIKIMTDEIPGNGTLEVRLMRYKSTGPGSSIVYRGMVFANIMAYFLDNNQLYPSGFEDVAMFDDSTEPEMLDEVDVLIGDAPDVPNKANLYVNIARLSDETPTLTWGMEGNDTDFSLLSMYIKMLASKNIYPKQTLDGTIKGANLGFESLVKHAFNSNREFEISICEWDVYSGKWDVTLREWFAFSDQDVSFDSGSALTGAANLTVATVVPDSYSIIPEDDFDTTVHIDNTGESTGRQRVQWKIVDGSDSIVSSGVVTSGAIDAADDIDLVIAMTAPEDAGTYYVKCKVITDTTWVSSAAITVAGTVSITLDSIVTIADGMAGDPMIVQFKAINSGGAGSVTIYWRMRDAIGEVINSGSQSVSFSTGTAFYDLEGLEYSYLGGINNDLQIGLAADTMVLTSNEYDVTTP